MAPAVAWSAVTGPVAFGCVPRFTLGFWTLFLRARVSGKGLLPCFGVNPRLLLGEFQLPFGDSARAVRTWKSGHLATLSVQYLARQWIQALRLFLEASGRISSNVFVKVCSDPAVDSRPALLGFFGSCSLEKCAQSLLRFRGLRELMALTISSCRRFHGGGVWVWGGSNLPPSPQPQTSLRFGEGGGGVTPPPPPN